MRCSKQIKTPVANLHSAFCAAHTARGKYLNNKQQMAVKLAQRGFRIIPLPVNKKAPPPEGWKALATSNDEKIGTRWERRFANHNIGIATGQGLLVVDVDTKGREGLNSLELLELAGMPTSFRVRTPSGGIHVYISVPLDIGITVSADRLKGYPGIDIRCEGGYVVAPGSTIDGVPYEIIEDRPIEPAGQWLIDIIKAGTPKTRERNDAAPLIEPDHPSAIIRATHYLVKEAPEAIEGAGGNDETYRVVCRVREQGVSAPMCLDLMLEHWNEVKASPPWMPEALETLISHAYEYATSPQGAASGLAEFGPVDIEDNDHLKKLDLEWIREFDPAEIPKRAWILGHFLARGYLTGLVAPPGAGKTTLEILMAIALASGADICGMKVKERCKVLLWNQEDELDELKRRLAAALQANKLSFDDIMIDGEPAILLGSGVENALMFARRGPNDKIVATKEADAMEAKILETGIGAAFFDPFVELHPADENNNVEISQVGRVFRALAVRARCAVLLVHHTRKPPSGDASGHAGSMESARGAGSLIGVTRMGATLYGLDEKTAEAYGVVETERHKYVRFDDGKNNMALAAGEPTFFKREGINIGTFEEPEEVGVIRPVVLEKGRPKAQQKADALADDIRLILGDREMRVRDLAKELITNDEITYGDRNLRSFADTITKHLKAGKLSGLELAGQGKGPGVGRPGAIVRAICDNCDEGNENVDAKSENTDKSTD